MKHKFKIALFLFMLFPPGIKAQDATEIVKKSDDRVRGRSSKVEMTINIIRPKYQRSMSMIFWSLGTEYSLILVTKPKKDEGTTFLKRGQEIWNWVPSIERSIKLPPSMMSQNWMGTDFTNDDLVKQSSIVVDYTHKIIGEEKIGDYDCWKIELDPKPDAAVVWGKILIWISKKDFMQLKIEFYDEDAFLVNTMTGKEPKVFDGILLPAIMEMVPVDKPGNKTVMITESMKFDIPVTVDFFTTRKMRTVKTGD